MSALLAIFGPAWPVIAPFLLLIVGGSITGLWVIINRRGGDKSKQKNNLPPTWPEMWARIDAVEEKNKTLDERVEALEEENRTLKHSNKIYKDERVEIFAHIKVLEDLVPTPPGAPAHPDWSKNDKE